MANYFFDEKRDPLGFERDRSLRMALTLHDRDAKDSACYIFSFLFVEACGISVPKLCQLAELHRDMMVETGDLKEGQRIGGVGNPAVLRRVLAGEQRPGYEMLCLWMRALHFYWYRPEVQELMIANMQKHYDDLSKKHGFEKREITAEDVTWNPALEDGIFQLFGYCTPSELEINYVEMTEPAPDRSGTNIIDFRYNKNA